MFFHFNKKQNAPVSCPVSVIFEIIKEDLSLGICCDISFLYHDHPHIVGVWGDNGETKTNLKYYLDKQTYSSLDELKQSLSIDNTPFSLLPDTITVTECDGCYPRSTPLLEQYFIN